MVYQSTIQNGRRPVSLRARGSPEVDCELFRHWLLTRVASNAGVIGITIRDTELVLEQVGVVTGWTARMDHA